MYRILTTVAALCIALGVVGCKQEGSETKSAADQPQTKPADTVTIDPALLRKFNRPPLPKQITSPDNPITEAKVSLGRMLYYDTRLSKNHDISCNSCHALDKYGVDGQAVSTGHRGQKGGRSAPSVYHAAGHIAQFWDGRAKDVEEQAKGPILNPIEMAMPSAEAVIKVLQSIPGYVENFRKAFPDDSDPVTYDNLGKAIGAFERGLVTPAPFDRFLAGEENALTDEEKRGLNTFVDVGCTDCHRGTYLGGKMYEELGAIESWPNQKDQGRYEVSKDEADKMVFKVQSLRNIAKTGPYFHDGSVKTLEEAVTMMAWHQLGQELAGDQVRSIVAFLNALTGEIPTDYIKEPQLPPSTDQTPKPDPR